MRRNILLFIAALLPIVASAYDAKIDGIYYNFSGDKAEVTSGDDKYLGSVVIPESVTIYNGRTYRVTSIGYMAFNNCSDLSSITIPNSMTSIGDYAFSGCSGLQEVWCYAEAVPSTSEDTFDGINIVKHGSANANGRKILVR